MSKLKLSTLKHYDSVGITTSGVEIGTTALWRLLKAFPQFTKQDTEEAIKLLEARQTEINGLWKPTMSYNNQYKLEQFTISIHDQIQEFKNHLKTF